MIARYGTSREDRLMHRARLSGGTGAAVVAEARPLQPLRLTVHIGDRPDPVEAISRALGSVGVGMGRERGSQ